MPQSNRASGYGVYTTRWSSGQAVANLRARVDDGGMVARLDAVEARRIFDLEQQRKLTSQAGPWLDDWVADIDRRMSVVESRTTGPRQRLLAAAQRLSLDALSTPLPLCQRL